MLSGRTMKTNVCVSSLQNCCYIQTFLLEAENMDFNYIPFYKTYTIILCTLDNGRMIWNGQKKII